MAGLPDRGIRVRREDAQDGPSPAPALVEERCQRGVTRELGLSGMTAGKYVGPWRRFGRWRPSLARGGSGRGWPSACKRCSPNRRSEPLPHNRLPSNTFECARSVPKRGPKTTIRHPTPTKSPIKSWPEIIDFRPVMNFPAALAKLPPSATSPCVDFLRILRSRVAEHGYRRGAVVNQSAACP